jgi:hypothetical protein
MTTSNVAASATVRVWMPCLQSIGVERKDLSDRQFEALLERLDRLGDEVARLNRRLDRGDELNRIVRELSNLNEALQALAYAALGHQGPQVRRRRTG